MAEPSPEVVEDLFQEVADLDTAHRGALLDERCTDDPELRAAVEELLDFDARAGETPDFLRGPASDLRAALRLTEFAVPASFGRYRVLRCLGEGGMGTVYEAEQDSPPRTVALKVIRTGVDSADSRKRFAREVRILGRLDHVGIARVYDSGATEDGRLYLAMEYIRGLRLDEHVRRQDLDIRDRLDLVARVCDAVQHAHEQGVVHRDLKPANILVDEAGEPKVLDFGVAQATGAGHPGSTLRTRTGQLIGTLGYMSPEQVAGDPRALDARSDVYTLGVILFELLAGRLPYRLDDLPVPEIVRVIRDEEPSRLGSMDRRFRGEVETIVARALEKERTRRYQSADELAEDLRRHLARQPIRARRIGAAGRYWRWARRNPWVATLGGVLTALLVLATIGSLLAAGRFSALADRERKSANAERSARAKAQKAEQEMKKYAAEAEARKLVAERETRRAEGEKKRAEEQLARSEGLVYAGKLMLAHNDFESGRGGLALHYLSECQAHLCGWEFRHLWGRINARQTLVGHRGAISSAAFSPDGSRILTGSADGTARVWDAATAEPLLTLEGHRGEVQSVAFSPDGKRLISADGEFALDKTPGDVKVWDAATGRKLFNLLGHSYRVKSVAFSPDGSRILTGAGGQDVRRGEAKIWDASTGREVFTLAEYTDCTVCVAYSPDGRRFATGAANGTAKLWDAHTGRELLALRDSTSFHSLAFSPDGRRIATGLGGGVTKVWDTATGRKLLEFKGHFDGVRGVAFSPDGRRIVTGSDDHTTKVWDAAMGRELFTLKGHSGQVRSVSFSPDGRRILTSSDDRTARVWDAATGQQIPILRGHADFVSAIAFSPDSRRIITSSGDGTARIWDAATTRLLRTLGRSEIMSAPERRLWCLAISPDGRRIVTGGQDRMARVWDATTGRELFEMQHYGTVMSLAFSPDGRCIVVGTGRYDGATSAEVKVHDAGTGRELLAIQRKGPGVRGLAFSPDGTRILAGCDDGRARVWDATTGLELLVLQGHAGAVTGVAFRRDGRRLLTGSSDRTARVWDAATGLEVLSLKGHTHEVRSVAFSPDGERIVTGSDDRSARVWDAETGQELLAFMDHPNAVWSVAFSPDGSRIVTGIAGANATASVWYAGRGQEALVLEGQGEMMSVAFSPDGRQAFGWDVQKRIKAWSTADGRPIDPRNPPRMPSPGPALSLDGFLQARPEGRTIIVTDRRPPPRDNAWPLPNAANRERSLTEQAWGVRPQEVEQARNLVNSGIATFQQGRFADSYAVLQRASELLRASIEELRDDPVLARLNGLCHGFLSSTLRELKRPGEALAHCRESLDAYELIEHTNPENLYNMACDCAMLSVLDERATPADREKLLARGVEYLRRAIEGGRTQVLRLIPADHDLDPLRDRADFRGLIDDANFPSDPFEQASPIRPAPAMP